MTSFSAVMFATSGFCFIVIAVLIFLMTKNHTEYEKSKFIATLIFIILLTIFMTADFIMGFYQIQTNYLSGDFGVVLN